MSDFDREAEREKLREQFERDKQKREASERMSELLLQGATMTNRHCPECHSPVFRYDGKEFCPTCQREVTEDGEFADEAGADGEAPAAAESADAQAATDEETEADDTASAEGEVDAGVERTETADTPEQEPDDDRPTETRQPTETQATEETRPAPARDRRPARVDPPARRERSETESEGGDLGEAEAALVREITNLTRRAEETRDVGRKRDLFAAAREATETLRELRLL